MFKKLSLLGFFLPSLFPEKSKQYYMQAEEATKRYSHNRRLISSTSSGKLVKELTFSEVAGCSPENLRRNPFTVIFVEFY